MEGRCKIGGTKENTGCGKGDAPKTLNMRILLWCVSAREAEADLAVIKEFAKVVRNKGGALIGTDDGWLECVGEAHLRGDVGGEVGERGGSDGGCGAMVRIEAAITGAGVNYAAIVGEPM